MINWCECRSKKRFNCIQLGSDNIEEVANAYPNLVVYDEQAMTLTFPYNNNKVLDTNSGCMITQCACGAHGIFPHTDEEFNESYEVC